MQTYAGKDAIPPTTLILGTDAAGKDHVANIVCDMIAEAGGVAQKRKHFLTGKATRAASSTGKGSLSLLAEKSFLALYPALFCLLPLGLTWLLRFDVAVFRQPQERLVIIGHNCLRGLAFHYGQRHGSPHEAVLPKRLVQALAALRCLPGLHTIVLDVDDTVRQARITRRRDLGQVDNFDLYMAGDSVRSERIEAMLVWLCGRHLNAQLIVNNDCSEEQLRALIVAGAQKRECECQSWPPVITEY